MAKLQNEEAFARAVGQFGDAEDAHDEFVGKVEDRYKTYRGVLDFEFRNPKSEFQNRKGGETNGSNT